MKIDRNALIRRVAEKHQLILTDDDPLITSVTLNEVIFEQHHELLLKALEEQGVKVLSALQTVLSKNKVDQRKEQDRLLQLLGVLHQSNLAEYKKIAANSCEFIRAEINSAIKANRSSKNVAIISTIIGIIFLCANLYLVLK